MKSSRTDSRCPGIPHRHHTTKRLACPIDVSAAVGNHPDELTDFDKSLLARILGTDDQDGGVSRG